MGVALGREGALNDSGGVVANLPSDWFGMTLAQRKVLIACGVGAGWQPLTTRLLGERFFAAEVLLDSLILLTMEPAFVASLTRHRPS
jgi:H+/Cl- antiporter ClcA